MPRWLCARGKRSRIGFARTIRTSSGEEMVFPNATMDFETDPCEEIVTCLPHTAADRAAPVVHSGRRPVNHILKLAVSVCTSTSARGAAVAGTNLPSGMGPKPGELARMFNAENRIGAELHVVEMKNWQRRDMYWMTGLPWIPPSPNLPAVANPGSVSGD